MSDAATPPAGLPDHLPDGEGAQSRVEPIYETIEGWKEPTANARSWADLPAQAIKYVLRVEEPLLVQGVDPRGGVQQLVHVPVRGDDDLLLAAQWPLAQVRDHIVAFAVTSEEAVAKGVRRLVALTGKHAESAIAAADELAQRAHAAAQLTGTNMRSARLLFAWMALATSSLPVPLSPRISTEVSTFASF